MRRAMEEIAGADFGLLFCEPHLEAFYRQLGWRTFEGQVYADQPHGRIRFDVTGPMLFDLRLAPRFGVLDLCGRPW